MGTLGSAGPDKSARAAPRASARRWRRAARAVSIAIESASPFLAGGLLTAVGTGAALSAAGVPIPASPLGDVSIPVSLLIAGAGAGVLLSAWETHRSRRALAAAEKEAAAARSQRDLALLQARRMRAQAEGLALMREIHRSTAIAERGERLHRILSLLADLFEAREVALFAAVGKSVLPAACLRVTSKEEFFVTFETEELARQPEAADASTSKTGLPCEFHIAKNGTNIFREGCQLSVDGPVERRAGIVGKAKWRRGAQCEQDPLNSQDPRDLLEQSLARLDFNPTAYAVAAQAIERRRTTRIGIPRGVAQSGSGDGLVLCVPLLADQRPVGVLRIRRSAESFDGPEAEALEELLVESGKHIALAMKKDEDDRKAITDVLTSLFIKRHFLDVLDQMRADFIAGGDPFCLVLSDIDHFKKVNDTHGHLSGDMILKGVAGVLRTGLRAGDMAFRYGGEEMALLLPHCTLDAAESTAERLRSAIQATTFKGEKGQVVPVTISMGIAQFEHGLNGEALISRADRGLYSSKANGRNRVTRWSAQLADPLDAKANGQAPTAAH